MDLEGGPPRRGGDGDGSSIILQITRRTWLSLSQEVGCNPNRIGAQHILLSKEDQCAVAVFDHRSTQNLQLVMFTLSTSWHQARWTCMKSILWTAYINNLAASTAENPQTVLSALINARTSCVAV